MAESSPAPAIGLYPQPTVFRAIYQAETRKGKEGILDATAGYARAICMFDAYTRNSAKAMNLDSIGRNRPRQTRGLSPSGSRCPHRLPGRHARNEGFVDDGSLGENGLSSQMNLPKRREADPTPIP